MIGLLISLISICIAWCIRNWRPLILQLALAILVPSVVSVIVVVTLNLFFSSGEVITGWSMIVAALWAIIGVPICVASVLLRHFLLRKNTRNIGKGGA